MVMQKSSVCFGTSGVRGLVSDLTDQICGAYTTAFLQEVVPQAKHIVLGCDLRSSSPRIAKACASAIHAENKNVIFVGALPTPALAYYALQEKIPAIMITGSHIPFDRNGIKFYAETGEISKAHETVITQAVNTVLVDNLIATDELPYIATALENYKQRYLQFFPANFLQGSRIGVYEHSSVARDFLPDLLRLFGAEVISLGRTDEFVPIDTEAVSEEDQALGRKWATEYQLDALLSTDGDADRPLIGDETGNWLRGDIVGLLCATYLGAKVVVTPVSCTTSIERCGKFSDVIRTKIGSPYVISEMEAALASGKSHVVGFEANGGFLVGDSFQRNGAILSPLPTRDAVLPMLALLALAKERTVPLSQLTNDLPHRFTASDRIKNFPNDISHELLEKLITSRNEIDKLFKGICTNVIAQDATDGLRLTFASDEIIHLRPSGNAPELRCYAEAGSDLRANDLVKMTLQRMLTFLPLEQNHSQMNKNNVPIHPQELIQKYSLVQHLEFADDYFSGREDHHYLYQKPFYHPQDCAPLLSNLGQLFSEAKIEQGMNVLDFAAGSCWLSRILVQLGCQVTSCDASAKALAIGKALFEKYPPISATWTMPTFSVFNGIELEFANNTFDRIIVNDAFHHVTNIDSVLKEFYRILKPGGLVAMSEPGRYHSQTADSQFEMIHFNVVENDIVLENLWQNAEVAGFDEIRILPVLRRNSMTLDEYLACIHGNIPDKVATGLIQDTVNHSIFFLSKNKKNSVKNQIVDENNFDENYYLNLYPDVALAVRRSQFKNGWQHYDSYGRYENRCSRLL